jgi:opacity protein-like surface antigen
VRISTFCFVGALLLSAGPAAAAGSHEFGFGGGTSLPTGAFSDGASAGYNLGAIYQFNLDPWGAGLDIKYNGWGGSSDMNASAEALYGAGSKVSYSAWQYDVFGVYDVPLTTGSMRPFLKAGFGAYSPSTKLHTPTSETKDSSNEFGVMGGIGMDYALSGKVKVGFDAIYHRIKNSPDDFFSAGVRVMWPFTMGMNGGD